MDTNLPNLDIVDDIAEVMTDKESETEEPQQQTEETEPEDTSPFVKPKKVVSEKQKAHLEKIRKLAKEKKQVKAQAKKEALEKVNLEHKAKSYKPRKPKPEPEPEPEPEPQPEKATKHQRTETSTFMDFMDNMEKYKILKNEYNRTKTAPKPAEKPKETPKPEPKPEPINLIQPAPVNPYANFFG